MNEDFLSVPGVRGEHVNVSAGERVLSAFAGGVLASVALRQDRPWSTVALAAGGGMLIWRALTGNCPAYRASGVNSAVPDYQSQHTHQVTTINAPASDIYAFWRDFANLPRIMYYLEAVEVVDETHSLWRAKGPAGKIVEWTAEIVDDVPNERISWRSTGEALVPNSGTVEFRPAVANRGTVVSVSVSYQPPAGKLGLAAAKLLGRTPGTEIREDLRRLKSLMETGEIPTTHGQSAGHHASVFDSVASFGKQAVGLSQAR